MMKYFVTGTDTDVGKTLVSAWLCLHLKTSYWKPIQSGRATDRDYLQKLNADITLHSTPYFFPTPVSPHLAAQQKGETISLHALHLPKSEHLIVEGAGGVLVPINKTETMLDVMKHLNLPIFVVARNRLGVINHTLLTLHRLRYAGLFIAGVIMNDTPNDAQSDNAERDSNNITTINDHPEGAPVLASLPRLENITKQSLLSIPLPVRLRHRLGMASSKRNDN